MLQFGVLQTEFREELLSIVLVNIPDKTSISPKFPRLLSQPDRLLWSKLRLKFDGTRAETKFCLSAKRTSPFQSTGVSVLSTTGSRGLRISGNAGYTKFLGSAKGTGYPLHSPVSPSLSLPCATVYHHVSTGLYFIPYSTTHSVATRRVRRKVTTVLLTANLILHRQEGYTHLCLRSTCGNI